MGIALEMRDDHLPDARFSYSLLNQLKGLLDLRLEEAYGLRTVTKEVTDGNK